MEHCAVAVLFANGGVGKRRDVPKSHEHIIQHFGKLVEGKPGILGECGRMLGRARSDRMTADYGLIESVSEADARETASDARRFIDACAEAWGLDRKRFKLST